MVNFHRTNQTPQPLLDIRLERTLDAWVRRFATPQWRGCHLQGWLFEGRAARLAAQQQLAAAGVQARLYSAYKPLVHHFLEAVDCRQLRSIRVLYPQPECGIERRFALEAYPLGQLLPAGAMELQPRQDHQPWYDLHLRWQDGRETQERVHAPNRIHPDSTGTAVQSPTGWLRVGSAAGQADLIDAAVTTDYEQVFMQVMDCIQSHVWPQQEPFFQRLNIQVELPGFEQPIAWAGETMSTLEALHEDVYFSLLEYFQQHSGRAPGDRRLQPGQIVPDIRGGARQPRVQIRLQPWDASAQDADREAPGELHDWPRAPSPGQIQRLLQSWPGQRFTAPTRQGRTVHGLYQAGSQQPVLLSAGQHANETSGIVGVLRAADLLRQQPQAHFALIALENPDGYALQRELSALHPGHMHHAARYSALGDDIEYREQAPLLERRARQTALALSGAQLHINLHGYPAHEWTRPLSGYMPRGFEPWMLPKGFFLILRYHAGWQAPARALLQAVCQHLASVPGLAAFNQAQRRLYECHAGPLPFELIEGIACMQSETGHDAPVTLISEFPDETITGEAFRFAHRVQMETVLAAVQAWQTLAVTGSSYQHTDP